MKTNPTTQSSQEEKITVSAINLLSSGGLSQNDVEQAIIEEGNDADLTRAIVSNLMAADKLAQKEKAQKDMLYGALWCIGGIIATAAEIGYIFWGAILFGGIQFFKGLINMPKERAIQPSEGQSQIVYTCTHCNHEEKHDFEYCPVCLKNDDGLTIDDWIHKNGA